MREIKFRAWDKTRRHVFKVTSFDFVLERVEIWVSTIATVLRFSEIELMQYTGLKDKNGVEIYEGDIVHHEAGEYSYVGVVETDCYKSYISGIDPVDAFDFDDVSDTRSGTADLEVIGNKFDNPELLEG